MSKLSPNNLVAQANKMIEGRYESTRNELLIINAMASLINPKDQEFPDFRVTVDELCKILDISRASAIREFKNISERLLKKLIVIDSKEYGWSAFQWVSKATLIDGVVTLKFHDELKPYLLELKKEGNFTQYRLGNTTGFRSIYSIRIYELLKSHYDRKIYNFEFALNDFRQMVLGQDSKSYPTFKNFRPRVLSTAQKELGEKDKKTGLYKSDLNFDLKTRRTGRKISHLIFTIKTQPTKPVLPKSESGKNRKYDDKAPQIIRDYEFYGLDRRIVEPFLKERGEESLQNTLEKFKADKENGKIKKNEQGYLRHLLKSEAGQPTESQKTDKEQEKQKVIEAEKQKKTQELEDFIGNCEREFGNKERQIFIDSLSDDQRDDIKSRLIIEFRGVPYAMDKIKKEDFLSMIFIPHLNAMIPDFEERQKQYVNEQLDKR